ncbi:MAG: acetyl-CoA decarbonylase/synthase complex subunit gamma [Chloroflexi bacterium]|nr:acetyl-CoA decarbonylase/synthase complex subunit gamma [Chloroflexota bacterium]
MALSGLEIYKLLPKTNCKECGQPTCLAFAMKLATKAAELSACPYVSEESKMALESAGAPPIRLVAVGAGQKKLEVGNETVMYRHDKTFFHPPGLVIRVKDTQSADEIAATVQTVNDYGVERVGLQLTLNGIAIENTSGSAEAFAKCAELVKSKTDQPMVLISAEPAAIEAALNAAGATRPLVYAATKENWEAMAAAAKKHGCPLAIRDGDGLAGLANLAEQVTKAGVTDVVLDPDGKSLTDSLALMTQVRRMALRKNFRLLGYPMITFPSRGASSPEEEVIAAAQHITKYGGIVVLDNFDPSQIYPLMTLRQNIYTDPQKPIQVKPEIYPFGEPNEKSPLLITTNFSLTYFTVAGEVEASGVPTWLLIADSEGMSVLTAWAAGKFDAEKIAKAVKTSGIADKIGHRKLVLPGYVAGMSGEVEEELPGWKIAVGPREAVDISPYLKTVWKPD